MNHGKKTFYDLTPQPKDEVLAKLDYLIDAVNFLLIPTEGNA